MKHYELKNVFPATCWQDATPVGSGRLSALVYGNVYADKILLNHEEWWYKESTPELPDFGDCLKRCRVLMDEGKYYEAERIFPDEMAKYRPLAAAALYQPGIDLRIESETAGEYTDYLRYLDMSKGVMSVKYKDGCEFERSVFASRADDVIVVRIQGRKKWSGRIWLEPHEPENAVGIFGEPFVHGIDIETAAEADLIRLQGTRKDVRQDANGSFAIIGTADREKYFGALMRIALTGGNIKFVPYTENDLNRMMPAQENGMKKGVIAEISDADNVLLLIKLYQGEEKKRYKKELFSLKLDYETLLSRHVFLHSELFFRTAIDFADESERPCEQLLLDVKQHNSDNELLNKLWYFGRYLFLISTKENCLPAHLTGKWNGDYFAPWRGVYFIDENTEIIYWQAYAGNMPELILPLFDFIESKLEDFRENAKKMFGCRGIRIPIYLDVFSGHEKDYSPHALYWNGGAAWLAAMYYDYFEFMQDEEFLLDRAYPFMKEAALFFEDFLVEKEGALHCYPSTSPENCANGDFDGAGKINVCIDATMDISLLKNLLLKLVEVSKFYNLDANKRTIWEAMLLKLPDYRVNNDGALAEWLHPDFKDNYRHRHLSHLFPVFPGSEIDETHTLFKAADKALEQRMAYGLKDMTGWALAHTANVYAHLKNTVGVKRCLNLISRHFIGKNFFGYHNNDELMGVGVFMRWCNHAPHQLDVSSGFTSALQEALCFSANGLINILPAFEGNVLAKGILLRGGITVKSLQRTDNQLNLELCSLTSQKVKVCLPEVPSQISVNGENVGTSTVVNITLVKGKNIKLECIL